MQPSVSVIIPTYNRPNMLALTLPSYLKSDLVQEVWIVDDGSTPGNWQRVLKYTELDPRIRCVQNEKNCGIPATRNRGMQLATAELLLLSEDDLELGENTLETLVEHLQRMNADLIAGRRLWMRVGESKDQVLKRTQGNRLPPVNLRWLDVNSHAITTEDIEMPLLQATMLMRRQVAEIVHHSDSFGGPSSWREDSDFQLNALRFGFKQVFCPHTTSFHHARTSASFGDNRWKNYFRYLDSIYRNNRLFLYRHQEFLRSVYPQSLIFNNVELTALLYLFLKVIWFSRAEVYRWYRRRKYKAFSWQ